MAKKNAVKDNVTLGDMEPEVVNDEEPEVEPEVVAPGAEPDGGGPEAPEEAEPEVVDDVEPGSNNETGLAIALAIANAKLDELKVKPAKADMATTPRDEALLAVPEPEAAVFVVLAHRLAERGMVPGHFKRTDLCEGDGTEHEVSVDHEARTVTVTTWFAAAQSRGHSAEKQRLEAELPALVRAAASAKELVKMAKDRAAEKLGSWADDEHVMFSVAKAVDAAGDVVAFNAAASQVAKLATGKEEPSGNATENVRARLADYIEALVLADQYEAEVNAAEGRANEIAAAVKALGKASDRKPSVLVAPLDGQIEVSLG